MESAYQRFLDSMQMDYDKWHDGVGYDLDALRELTPAERAQAAALLKGRTDWRDAEALQVLAELGDTTAGENLAEVLDSGPTEQKLIALERLRDAGQLSDAELEQRLLPELKTAAPYGGLTPALRLVQQVPTPRVKRRLLWGVLQNRQASVHYAAMLAFLAGKAEEEFDWNLRPLFLRCNDDNPITRKAAVEELCALIGMKVSDAE